jgi:hypothetical protein
MRKLAPTYQPLTSQWSAVSVRNACTRTVERNIAQPDG